MTQPALLPAGHPAELDSPDRGLYFDHSPVGPESFMHPTKPWRMGSLVDRLIGLPMVLVRPHPRPEDGIVRGDHTAFPARGHDLVLAKGPRTNLPERPDRAPCKASAMRLSTILNHGQPVLIGQRHDGGHVARPSRKMHADDPSGPRRQHGLDGHGIDILAVSV